MSRAKLDELAPDFPAVVWHRSCHEFFLSRAPRKRIGIDAAFMDGLTPSQKAQSSFEKGHFSSRARWRSSASSLRTATPTDTTVVLQLAKLMSHGHN